MLAHLTRNKKNNQRFIAIFDQLMEINCYYLNFKLYNDKKNQRTYQIKNYSKRRFSGEHIKSNTYVFFW